MSKLFFKLALLVSAASYCSFMSTQEHEEYYEDDSVYEDISLDSEEHPFDFENYTCEFEEVDSTNCFKGNVDDSLEMQGLPMDNLLWDKVEKSLLAAYPNDTYLKAIVNNDSASILLNADDVNKHIRFVFCIEEDNEVFLHYGSIFTYLGFAITKLRWAKTDQERADMYTLVKALLEKGAQPNALLGDIECYAQPGSCSWSTVLSSGTPATLAVDLKDAQMLELLLTYGACANSRSHTYADLLAAAYPDLTLIDLIKHYLVLQRKEMKCAEEFKDFSFLNELTCPKDGQKVIHSQNTTYALLDDEAITYDTY